MSIEVENLPLQILPKWNLPSASPHPLCCDSSSDSETDSVFDSTPGEEFACECFDGVYSTRLKLAAIPPVVATASATGNFLAATTVDSFLLELIGQDDATARPLHGDKATSGPEPADSASCISPVDVDAPDAPKCREVRVNSDFLRQYALDYRARVEGVLPMSDDIHEVERLAQIPALKKFDAQYGLARVSALSKEKLWHSVVLEAREDARPHKSIMTAQTGNPTAAAPLRLLLPLSLPAGVLASARHMHHSSDWCTMSTFTQYTRKGWCNERWSTVT